MDTDYPLIIYFTLDELEKNELLEQLKEYSGESYLKLKTGDGIIVGNSINNK